jgi:hypothetical protein
MQRRRSAHARSSFTPPLTFVIVIACAAIACGASGSGAPDVSAARSDDDAGAPAATPASPGDAPDAALDATIASDAPKPPGVGLLHTAPELAFMRAHAASDPWQGAYQQVLGEAGAALGRTPVPVADFDIPFYYADPTASQAAKEGLRQDALAAYALALGYQLGASAAERDAYAAKAIAILGAWASVNKQVTGADGDLIVLYTGAPMLYAADLVWSFPGWTPADRVAFMGWVNGVFRPSAERIKTRTNNWGDWGTLGVVASAGLAHDNAAVAAEIARIEGRIASDIDAAGELPAENNRTNSGMWYTFFALTSMTTAARIAHNLTGVDLFAYTAPNGRTIRLALEREFFYAMHPDQWPYKLPDGAAGVVWRQLYPCDDTVQMPTPGGWPGSLFEIMSDVYQVPAWKDYVASYRPSKGFHGWIYPTLMRQTP